MKLNDIAVSVETARIRLWGTLADPGNLRAVGAAESVTGFRTPSRIRAGEKCAIGVNFQKNRVKIAVTD